MHCHYSNHMLGLDVEREVWLHIEVATLVASCMLKLLDAISVVILGHLKDECNQLQTWHY